MFATRRRLLSSTLLLCAAASPHFASAGGRDCHKCGCKDHVEKKLIAVVECRKIKTPTYDCVPTNVFHPSRAMVCKSQCRCDTICKLHKNCDCTISCTCKTKCGYKRQYGASTCGTHSTCDVRQPVGSCEDEVTVVKWIAVPVCKDCYQKTDRTSATRH